MKEEYPTTDFQEKQSNTEVVDVDQNMTVTQYVPGENEAQPIEETQDLFLDQQLSKFLSEDLVDILQKNKIQDQLKETKSIKNYESEVSDDLLYLHNLIDDADINITEEDILNFLQIENRWPFKYFYEAENPRPDRPDIFGFDCPIQTIVSKGRSSFMEFYNRQGDFIFDEWKKLYDRGFTSMISNVLDLTPELRSLRNKIRDYTGSTPLANFYITDGTSKNIRNTHSWKPHDHHYPVVVKILYGDTKWIINDEEKEFSKGDTLFIPPQTLHGVVDCPTKRLSLTINLQ